MKTKTFVGILCMFLYSVHAFAQTSEDKNGFKSIQSTLPGDKLFIHTVEYLQDNGYFLLALDKSSGFIQAKKYISNTKLLSGKLGERRTVNFIISPIDENVSNIRMDIYVEDFVFHGGHTCYYYEEKGISNDVSLYKKVLDGLQEFLAKMFLPV